MKRIGTISNIVLLIFSINERTTLSQPPYSTAVVSMATLSLLIARNTLPMSLAVAGGPEIWRVFLDECSGDGASV